MSQQLYSVEQVAELLGLHVKTVRAYVREGRLKAVRIGKQYRIARADLEALTGGSVPAPARDTVSRRRQVEVSAIVRVDAISQASMMRVSNTLVAAANSRGSGGHLRIETVYDEERATLKIIVLGDLDLVTEVLAVAQQVLED